MKLFNTKNSIKELRFRQEVSLLLMAIPFIIFIIIFSYLPIHGWYIAFVKYSPGVSLWKSKFTGLDSFINLLSFSSDFPNAITNTLAMSFLGIIFSPVPIILALLLSEVKNMKVKKAIQTATSLPNFISMVIVFSLFYSIFAVDDGLLNNLLLNLGLISTPTSILGEESITWYFQTFIGIWKSAGWSAIIYLAAIAGIDRGLYDAAKVDGAGKFKQVIHVTIPGVMPTYLILLMLALANIFSSNFEQVYTFYNPLVKNKIETLDYYIYRIGLRNFEFSLSTAAGIMKSVISIMLLLTFNRIYKKIRGYSIF